MLTFSEYESFDGLGLANLVKTGVISPNELLEVAIERIEALNPKVNAVIYKMYDEARTAIKNGLPQGLFYGVPFLLKDFSANYAGTPVFLGSRYLRNNIIPTEDSEIVKRFKQAGLVILGKSNVPELALGMSTEPELFGPTRNPWDLNRSVASSSGGSAAAVAARMVPMAHANDGGGSIRMPSAYCGLFGLKPTYGKIPVDASIMQTFQGRTVDHVLTRTVRDSAGMLDALGREQDRIFLKSLAEVCPKLRMAFTENPFFPGTVANEYKNALHKSALLCESLGHSVECASFSIQSAEVAVAFMVVLLSEVATTVQLLMNKLNRKPKAHELELLTEFSWKAGTCFSEKEVLDAHQVLDSVKNQILTFFCQYDILMTPTMSSPPLFIGTPRQTRVEQGMMGLFKHVPYSPLGRKIIRYSALNALAAFPFVPLFNITGQPAMSVPLFWDMQGLPIGIQFVGRVGEDKILLQLAQQLEQAEPWEQKRPKLIL